MRIIAIVLVMLVVPTALAQKEQSSGVLNMIQQWQAAIGNRYQDMVDFPPLLKCATLLRSYLDSHIGVMGNYHRLTIRRAKADVIELESLSLNTTEHLAELALSRRKEASAIKGFENYKINLESSASGIMQDCYMEAKEKSDFYAKNRAVLKGSRKGSAVITANVGFIDQLTSHPMSIRFQAYVVLHAQVFITSAIVMVDGFVTTQLTAKGSPWRHLGDFMEKCVYKASTAFTTGNAEWEISMVSISSMSEERGVINAMIKMWSAYGAVLKHYGLAVAYTVAPFMTLVFFIVTAVLMAPVIVWYYLGYVLVWLVWVRRFFWMSTVVPAIAKVAGDSSIKLALSDMYLVSERLLSVDAKGDGGIVAALPIALLLTCTVAVIIFTATSLVLTLLDIAGGRWEVVEGQWEMASKRLELAEAETTEATEKSSMADKKK